MGNELCRLLGIQYPIMQGAMAWIADASLAASVSEAGGLGIIAAGNAPADSVRTEIIKAKERTDKPFGVNVMLLSPHVNDIVDLVCEEGIKVVTTGAGSPSIHIEKWKSHGIKVIPVVPSVAIAKKMVKSGADAVIAEGMESGGHVGKLTTIALLTQVLNHVDVPVIGAGGFYDGRGLAAALAFGAAGIQIGTRFLMSTECNVHQNFKDAIKKAKDIDTTVTGISTGHPVRVLRNKLARTYEKMEKENASPTELERIGSGALQKAAIDGDVVNGSVMAGQIAGAIFEEQTSKAIIEDIIKGYNDTVMAFKNGQIDVL